MTKGQEQRGITEYAVLMFDRTSKGVRPTDRLYAADPAQAGRIADRCEAQHEGLLVYSRRCDPELGDYDEPVVLETRGNLPPDYQEMLGG